MDDYADEGIRISEYIPGRTRDFDPEEPGCIKLFTYQTFKGLEFEAVFMPEVDCKYFENESPVKVNQSMVGITRAKERVFIGCRDPVDTGSFLLRRIHDRTDLLEIRKLEHELTRSPRGPSSRPKFVEDDIPF